MGSSENVLIVEDEEEWRGIYRRAISTLGSSPTVMVASDLASAERLIEATKFAVAFVDVSLDEKDERNADGLLVMEKIRAIGDETSIVVVSGRSGQDVMTVTRDAIKKYDAYDTVKKSSVEPSDINKLLTGGLEAYRSASMPEREDARDALRGAADSLIWDDRVMRATKFKGDASQFYAFLSKLLGDYLPIVTRRDGGHVDIDSSAGLVYGDYWSRSIAAAVAICFGIAGEFDQAIKTTRTGAKLLGRYAVGDPVKQLATHGVKGAVFPLAESRREDFGESRREDLSEQLPR